METINTSSRLWNSQEIEELLEARRVVPGDNSRVWVDNAYEHLCANVSGWERNGHAIRYKMGELMFEREAQVRQLGRGGKETTPCGSATGPKRPRGCVTRRTGLLKSNSARSVWTRDRRKWLGDRPKGNKGWSKSDSARNNNKKGSANCG
eukprot:g26002.t1